MKVKIQFNLILDLKYFGLRSTPSGHIVIQKKTSNTLTVFDKKLTKEVEFPGDQVDVVDKKIYREPHFSFEGNNILWFGGKNSLYIVDLRTLSQIKIDRFVGDGINPEPICGIADFRREKYLVFFEIEKEFVLIYSERDREPDPHLLDELFPKYNELKCMDLTKNKLYGVVGGWTEDIDSKTKSHYSKGCISAFKFTKSLDLVAEIELPRKKCSIVKKVLWSRTHEDVLFASTDGPLFILGFHSTINQFEVLKAIDIGGSKGTSLYGDMCIYGRTLFLADGDGDSHVIQVDFNSAI